MHGKYIWVLTNDGVIVRISSSTYTLVDSLKFKTKIAAIGKSRTDTLFAVDTAGVVCTVDDDNNLTKLWYTKQIVRQILFNSQNKCFLITKKGIFEPARSKKLYVDDDLDDDLSVRHYFGSSSPSATFIDSGDNIWLGFDNGEWGGDVMIFSTKKMQYLKASTKFKECYVRPVRSFFEINEVIYSVTSLQHFSIHSGIKKMADSCIYFFASPDGDGSVNKFRGQDLYLGPSLYNSRDSSIYFYCQFGVFKGNIKNDLARLENWSTILNPEFTWYYGMPHAVGYGMNVSNIFFDGDKLFLVSPYNGIFIWDSQQSILLKTAYRPPDD